MLNYDLIRLDIREALDRYVAEGCPTGGFLQAVLENNLREAFARADDDNIRTLYHIVGYCYNQIPNSCWGSPQAVEDWLSFHRERRRQESLEAEK